MKAKIQHVINSLDKDFEFDFETSDFEQYWVKKDQIVRIDSEESNVVCVQVVVDRDDRLSYVVGFEDEDLSVQYVHDEVVDLEMYTRIV